VLALLLLVRSWRRLVATITAFTVAHSITLAAATLGISELDPDWESRLPPHSPPTTSRRIARDAYWAGRYLAPWLVRRLRGVSSGDGIEPKRPLPAPVERPGNPQTS